MRIPLVEILSLIDAHDQDKSKPFAFDVLYERYPPKQVDAKFEKISRRGYINYGVSTRTGWLTSKGKAKLKELKGETN